MNCIPFYPAQRLRWSFSLGSQCQLRDPCHWNDKRVVALCIRFIVLTLESTQILDRLPVTAPVSIKR